METQIQKGRKLIVVGVVAAACVVAALYTSRPASPKLGMAFLQENSEVEQAFIQFIARYGRSYSSKEELPKRFEIFANNFRMVQAHNSKPEVLYQMEINKYSDMEISEYLQDISPSEIDLSEVETLPHLTDIKFKESIDWRDSDKLLDLTDLPNKCKASWAFVTAQTIESAAAILNKVPAQAVSVQQLIDCDPTNQYCISGWPSRAYKNIITHGYVMKGTYKYGYLDTSRACQETRDVKKFSYLRSRQYLLVKPDMMRYWIQYQPVGVSINVTPCVAAYKTGILSQNDCPCSDEAYPAITTNTLMTIVGYGVTYQDQKEFYYCEGYYLLRSTFGPDWGDKGHIKLCINKNRDSDNIGTCNIGVYPYLPDVGIIPPLA